MVSRYVLYVLVHHVKSDRFRLTIAPYGPRVLVAVVTLRFRWRRYHATRRCRRHPVLVDTRYHNTGYDFAQGVRQQHLQMYPYRSLEQVRKTHVKHADESDTVKTV